MSTPAASLSTKGPEFYVVAPHKFNLLFYFTLGFYGVYWSYRHWQAQKQANGLDVWPIMRGLFLVFFVHQLLRAAAEAINRAGKSFVGNPESLATTIVLLVIVVNVCDRLGSKGIGSPYTDWVGVLLLPFMGSQFLKAQLNLNLAAGDAEGAANAALSGANIAWIVVGCVLWLGTVFGLYAVTFAPELLS